MQYQQFDLHPNVLTKAEVIIDGDTFITSSGDTVRLIGINAPEIGRPFYLESKNELKRLIEDRYITLEADVQDIDDYDRLLRYVYVEKKMINLKMIENGFANIFTVPPNLRYSKLFLLVEQDAIKNGRGLWATSDITWISISGQHFDAEGDDNKNLNDEYLTIRNENDFAFDISGFSLSDQAGHEFMLSINLPANGDIFIRTGSGKNDDSNYYLESKDPIWNNDYETAYLWDAEDKLADIFIFDKGNQHPSP